MKYDQLSDAIIMKRESTGEGKEIERKGREIEIFNISNVLIYENKISFEVHCSKGTYIRTLCKDIGEKLGCGATMSKLERVRAGKFEICNSIKLDELEKEPEKYLIDLVAKIIKMQVKL